MIKAKTKADPAWQGHLVSLSESTEGQDFPRNWDDDHHYRLSSTEVGNLQDTVAQLYRMCMATVDHIFSNGLLEEMGISAAFRELLSSSWRHHTAPFCARIDLVANGQRPTYIGFGATNYQGLFSASILQWHWLQAIYPQSDQFNSIWPLLVDSFEELNRKVLHGKSLTFLHSEKGNSLYALPAIMDAANEASCLSTEKSIEHFFGEEERAPLKRDYIYNLCSFYEVQSACAHTFFPSPKETSRWIGGFWTLILDLPGFDQTLRSLFPQHPLLAKGVGSVDEVSTTFQIRESQSSFEGAEKGWTRISAWLVKGEFAGIGIRDFYGTEARFIPHIVI